MPIEDRDWYRPAQERCPQCGKIFPNENALLYHALLEHSQKEQNKVKTTGILQKLFSFFFRRV